MSKNLDELVGELTAFNHKEAAQAILKLREFLDSAVDAHDDNESDEDIRVKLAEVCDEYERWLNGGI